MYVCVSECFVCECLYTRRWREWGVGMQQKVTKIRELIRHSQLPSEASARAGTISSVLLPHFAQQGAQAHIQDGFTVTDVEQNYGSQAAGSH